MFSLFIYFPLSGRDFTDRLNVYRSYQDEQPGNLRGDRPRPCLQKLAFTRELGRRHEPTPLVLEFILALVGDLVEPLLDAIQKDVDFGIAMTHDPDFREHMNAIATQQ